MAYFCSVREYGVRIFSGNEKNYPSNFKNLNKLNFSFGLLEFPIFRYSRSFAQKLKIRGLLCQRLEIRGGSFDKDWKSEEFDTKDWKFEEFCKKSENLRSPPI